MRDRILKRMTDYYDLDERLYECVEDLLTELAPELEKARKWDRCKCKQCGHLEACSADVDFAESMFEALAEKEVN
jgi:hypothetical protein